MSRFDYLFENQAAEVEQPEQPEQQSTMGNVVDEMQAGALSALSGMFDFVGADGLASSTQQLSQDQALTMSDRWKESRSKELFTEDENGDVTWGEGASDLATWGSVLANTAGQFAGTAIPGLGVAGGAAKALSLGAKGKKVTTAVSMGATGGAAGSGQAMQQGRDLVLNMNFDTLQKSEKFLEHLREVDKQNPNSSDLDKLTQARSRLGEEVKSDIQKDPKLLISNFALSAFSDPIIANGFKKAIGNGVKRSVLKGMAVEGITEAIQGGTEHFTVGDKARKADSTINPMAGIKAAALTEGIAGGMMGGGMAIPGALMSRPTTELHKEIKEQVTKPMPSQAPKTGINGIDQGLQGVNDTVNKVAEERQKAAAKTDLPQQGENLTAQDVPVESAVIDTSAVNFDVPAVARNNGIKGDSLQDQHKFNKNNFDNKTQELPPSHAQALERDQDLTTHVVGQFNQGKIDRVYLDASLTAIAEGGKNYNKIKRYVNDMREQEDLKSTAEQSRGVNQKAVNDGKQGEAKREESTRQKNLMGDWKDSEQKRHEQAFVEEQQEAIAQEETEAEQVREDNHAHIDKYRGRDKEADFDNALIEKNKQEKEKQSGSRKMQSLAARLKEKRGGNIEVSGKDAFKAKGKKILKELRHKQASGQITYKLSKEFERIDREEQGLEAPLDYKPNSVFVDAYNEASEEDKPLIAAVDKAINPELKKIKDSRKRKVQELLVKNALKDLVTEEDNGNDPTPPKGTKGKKSKAFTPSNKEIEVEYRLAEADNLQASNDFSGAINPNFPKNLQPRARNRKQAQVQVSNIAKNPIPEKLADSPDTDRGAPIVNGNIVESGNGRTIGLQEAYRTGGAGKYKQYLLDNAQALGFTPEQINNMKAPILVRHRVTPMTDEELVQFTVDSNSDAGLSQSPAEAAQADASLLTDDDMKMLSVPENGNVLSPENSVFIQTFAKSIGNNEIAKYKQADGQWNSQFAARVNNAIFAKGYDNPQLLADMAESTTQESKNLINALMNVSAKLAETKSFNKHAGTELSNAFSDAASLIIKSRQNNTSVKQEAGQGDLLSGNIPTHIKNLAIALESNIRSGKKMTAILDGIASEVLLTASNANQNDIFSGEPQPINVKGAIENATQNNGRREASPSQDLFERSSEPSGDTRGDNSVRGDTGKSARESGSDRGLNSKTEKIEDFGEVLSGAAKHTYTLSENLTNDIDVKAEPLSKSFPHPDYEQLSNEGVDHRVLALISALRSKIKTKPRKGYKLNSWVDSVQKAREITASLLQLKGSAIGEAMGIQLSKKSYDVGFPLYLSIAQELDAKYIKELGSYDLSKVKFADYDGETNITKWQSYSTNKKSGLRNLPTRNYFDTKEDLKNFVVSQITNTFEAKGQKLAKFDIWTDRGVKGVYFVGKKLAANKYIELKRFDNKADALSSVEKDNAELVIMLKKKRAMRSVRRISNDPRIGLDHRSGVDVTPELFNDTFGFRGIQFGNYVSNSRRQEDLNNAYDGLMDLSILLNIPPQAISLNGEVGLAFGARGRGGSNAAMAHYEPDSANINLTKKMGAGSLAHEWFHALDNYFAKNDSLNSNDIKSGAYMSEHNRKRGVVEDNKYRATEAKDFAVREEVYNAFKGIKEMIKQETELAKRSAKMDELRPKAYWSTVREMTARTFERYVIDRLAESGYESDYLANIVSEEDVQATNELLGESDSYVYPLLSEMDAVNKAYDGLFNTLKTKETDKGIAFYNKSKKVVNSGETISVRKAESAAKQFIKQFPGLEGTKILVGENNVDMYGSEQGIFGAYDPVKDEMHLVSSRHSSVRELRATIHEELLIHKGLGIYTEQERMGIYRAVVSAAKSDPDVNKIYKEVLVNYKGAQNWLIAEETLGKIAHNTKLDKDDLTWSKQAFGRLRAFFKKILRRIGIASAGITKADLAFEVQKIAYALYKGKTPGPRTDFKDGDKFFRKEGEQSLTGKAKDFLTPKATSETLIANEDEGRINHFIRAIQDKFKPLKTVQKIIIKSGKTIADNENAYVAEELFHGKAEEDLRKMERDHVQPLVDALKDNNVELPELDLFLIAQHAKERNAHISDINEEFVEGGSGMTDSEAEAVIANFESEGKVDALNLVASEVYSMVKARQKELVGAGLLDESTVGSWDNNYQHYVPLKGFAEGETDSDNKSIPRVGQGFAIKGKETMQALGRRSMASSPATQVIQDLTETIIRKRKNEVGNAFLKLVKANPNSEYWQVFTDSNPEVRATFDQRTGKVVESKVPMAMMADQYFTTKVDGVTHYVKIEDIRLMNAMKNLGVDKVNGLIKTLGTVNRYLSTINTSLNPEFVISNMARDIQTAVFNVMAEQDLPKGKIKGKNIAKNMIKDWVAARKGIALSLAGKDQADGKAGEYQKLFDQFREDGAKTGYFDMKDIDQQVDDINNMMEMSGNSKKGLMLRTKKKLGDFIENINQSVENAVRLSAYKQALDVGISRQKAASLAKNLTVNFNRKGEAGTTLNALYMFSNASIQGTAQFLRSMQGYRDADGNYKFTGAQKAAAGFVAAGFTLAAINRALSDDDDDGISFWDKIPDYIKERNIVVMKSTLGAGEKGEYWSIPLPYGYNLFSVIGTSAESVAQGNKTTIQAAGNITGALLGSFSPIGAQGSDSVINGTVKTLSPTILSPWVQLAVNENFYGSSIYRENFPFGTPKPDSSLVKKGTQEHWKAISSFLNDVTGGSDFRSGAIDINPETFAHLFDFTTGAAGSFAARTGNAASKIVKGEKLTAREIPFYRKVNGETNDNHQDQSDFYDRADEIAQLTKEYKSLKGKEKALFRMEYKDELQLQGRVKQVEKMLKFLRKQYNSIESNSNLSKKDKAQRLDDIRARQDKIVDKFNKAYNAI